MHGRRVGLYHPSHVEALNRVLAECRAELSARTFEHLCKIADQNAELRALRNEVAEMRDILQMLVSIRRAEADSTVDQLRSQLTALLARLERRDPSTSVH
jgi:uncharacterized coiled-coil protein SlyX